jgi:hypothetical protein
MGYPLIKSKELKKLEAKWYKKLAKEGFEDIEQDENNLKQWHNHFFFARYDADSFNSKAEYFQLAGAFLHEYEFANEVEKKIWELHADGLPLTEIYKVLANSGSKVYIDGIRKIVNKLKEAMVSQCRPKKT